MLGWIGSCNEEFAPARFVSKGLNWGFRHELDEYDLDSEPKFTEIAYMWSWVLTRAQLDTVPAHWLDSVEDKYKKHKEQNKND